jgi:WW domain
MSASASAMSSTTSESPSVPPEPLPVDVNDVKEHIKSDLSAEPEASTSTSVSDSAPEESPSTPPAPASSNTPAGIATSGDWQAIWSQAHNAYYFYNPIIQQTTWENPLHSQPQGSASASASSPGAPSTSTIPPSLAAVYATQEAAAAQGIDPSLAHLDPSLAGPSGASGGAYSYSAKFNARTGTFTRPDGRDPSHLSEYERAKRMSEVYFDVNAWEAEVERQKEEEDNGKKRKRPTKKDLVGPASRISGSAGFSCTHHSLASFQDRFKEQKRLKKIAKTAWLRT